MRCIPCGSLCSLRPAGDTVKRNPVRTGRILISYRGTLSGTYSSSDLGGSTNDIAISQPSQEQSDETAKTKPPLLVGNGGFEEQVLAKASTKLTLDEQLARRTTIIGSGHRNVVETDVQIIDRECQLTVVNTAALE